MYDDSLFGEIGEAWLKAMDWYYEQYKREEEESIE